MYFKILSFYKTKFSQKLNITLKYYKSYLNEVKTVLENINHGPYYGEKRLKKIVFKTSKICQTLGDYNFFLNN